MGTLGQHHRFAGFTLIELMITLVIVAVLVGIAAPAFKDLVERNRLQTAAHNLFTDLMLARSEAVKRNQSVIVCKSSSGSACTTASEWEQGWLLYADADGDSVADPNEIITVHGALAAGDTLRTLSTGSFKDQVVFDTDGSASANEEFVLCNSDADLTKAREIDVAATGRSRLQLTTADCTP